jgi:acetate---CoA ligase (ADP-forming)
MVVAANSLELIIGARRDPRFGPVAAVGLGGIYAELLDDTACALAPVDEAVALDLLGSLRTASLLEGRRGRPRLALHAVARALAAISQVAAAHHEIAEIEVNPLLVSTEAAIGLDTRVVLSAP